MEPQSKSPSPNSQQFPDHQKAGGTWGTSGPTMWESGHLCHRHLSPAQHPPVTCPEWHWRGAREDSLLLPLQLRSRLCRRPGSHRSTTSHKPSSVFKFPFGPHPASSPSLWILLFCFCSPPESPGPHSAALLPSSVPVPVAYNLGFSLTIFNLTICLPLY